MPTPTQMGGAAAVVVGASLGSYAIYSFTTSEGEKLEAVHFKKDFDFSKSTDYKDKLLSLVKKDNLVFLAVPIPEEKDKEEIQKKWWDWAFKKKYENNKKEDKLDTIFKGIKKGFSDKDSDTELSLNQACKKAYKQEKSTYKFTGSNLLKNISDFCTKVEGTFDISEPISNTYTSNEDATGDYDWGLLKVEKNRTNLVKKEKGDNEYNKYWWDWAYENLYKKQNRTKSTSPFNGIQKGWSENAENTALNNACDAAYKKPEVTLSKNNNELLKNIQSFCTPGLQEVSLTKPTTPKTIKVLEESQTKSTDFTGGVAIANGNPQKLVDPDKADNQDWWNWAFRNRYKERETTLQIYTDLFDGIEKGWSTTNTDKALNQKCKEAFKKSTTDVKGDEKLLNSINEFCTKDKTQKIPKPN